MARMVAEAVVRARRFGPRLVVRIDLHGVSVFGPGDQRTLVRWEWIEAIEAAGKDVIVRSSGSELLLPGRPFGLRSEELAERLEEARSITRRPDVIGQLSGPATPG